MGCRGEVGKSNKKSPAGAGLFCKDELEGVVDLAEDVTDLGSQNGKDGDNNNGNENEDKCVFDESLTFFAR
jgi:hypothetical protein